MVLTIDLPDEDVRALAVKAQTLGVSAEDDVRQVLERDLMEQTLRSPAAGTPLAARIRAIWLVSLDPASGHEQKGRRPVLIVSPEAFNRITKLPVILPITSGGNFARSAGFAVPLANTGTKTTGVVRCDQPRALDFAARGGKKLESVPDALMDEVLARISPIFE